MGTVRIFYTQSVVLVLVLELPADSSPRADAFRAAQLCFLARSCQ